MSGEVVRVQLEEFLRTGAFGPVKFGMSREELQALLGPPDGVFQRRKDRNPMGLEYGDVEFYFLSSSDNRLCDIYLDHFGVPRGNPVLELDPWALKGGASREEVEAALAASGIPFQPASMPAPTMSGIVTGAGVVLGFDEEADDSQGLYSIGLSLRDRMEQREPGKQISIIIPEGVYERIRHEAARRREKMAKICSAWVVERAAQLPDK